MNVKSKTILVTGAGSGMGREITLELLNRGARVVAVDLNESTLNETKELAQDKKDDVYVKVLNITDKEGVFQLPEELSTQFSKVDGIINNAGIIQPFIDVKDLDLEKIQQVMDVNFYGTVYFIKAFLPHLLKLPEASIVNISSMGGFIPVPGQTVYGASKAAVKLLTEGLHSELRDTNVGVTIVFPGAIETNISTNSGLEMRTNSNPEESKFKAMPADEAAKIIVDALESKSYRVTVGKDARFLDRFSRFNPKRAANFIANQMAGLKQ